MIVKDGSKTKTVTEHSPGPGSAMTSKLPTPAPVLMEVGQPVQSATPLAVEFSMSKSVVPAQGVPAKRELRFSVLLTCAHSVWAINGTEHSQAPRHSKSVKRLCLFTGVCSLLVCDAYSCHRFTEGKDMRLGRQGKYGEERIQWRSLFINEKRHPNGMPFAFQCLVLE